MERNENQFSLRKGKQSKNTRKLEREISDEHIMPSMKKTEETPK